MRISIAMATYNGAKYLQDQLDSFVYQSRRPDELVVCDDSSNDETITILESFQAQAPFDVQLHRNERRLGYTKNFEAALSRCTGEVIFLSDQDDVWLCSKIGRIETEFVSRPEIMVIINNQFISDSDLSSTNYTSLGNIRSAGLTESWFISGCCTAIRRPFLDIVLPIPHAAHGHDAWISKLSDSLNLRHVYCEPLQLYRRHGANTSNWLISRPEKVTSFDLFLQYGFQEALIGWRETIAHYHRYRSRIIERTSALEALGHAMAARRATNRFSLEISALQQRIDAVSLPRSRRFPQILRLIRRGTYRHFSGWRSAAKDILRP